MRNYNGNDRLAGGVRTGEGPPRLGNSGGDPSSLEQDGKKRKKRDDHFEGIDLLGLVNLKFKDGDNIVKHISLFQSLANKLVAMKMNIDDEIQGLLLLSSLSESWETFVVTICNSTLEGTLTIDMVKDSLLNEDARRKEQGESSFGAFVTEKQERRGRSHSRNPYSYRGRSKSRRDIKCFHCNKPGHMKKESQDNNWAIDSCVLFHVTSHGDFFRSYTVGDFGNVRMGNNGTYKIMGIGDICLETSIGSKLILKDVRYVPNICLNLISTSRLNDEDFAHYFDESKWKLTKGSLIMARGNKLNSFYVLEAKLHKGEINAIQKGESIDLWHKRLGHISEKELQTLARKQFLPELRVPLKGDVQERVWRGKDISYNHLRVFGCKAFVHIPKDERSKLDNKAKACIFLGYGHEEFGYRLWDPVNKKIIRSRDVVFLEDQLFDDVYDDHGGDEQEDHGENVSDDTPTVDDIEPTEQAPPSPVEIPLRRSTRERQPSTRYPPHEYVMLTNEGESETYQEAILHEHKNE
uniref:Retrotransposon-like protein n=1 Tax=Musa acuminata TaxID=4641 RepID=Q6RZV5_MUSAC|nr:retrotransposon-like protein [Musa acuminata]